MCRRIALIEFLPKDPLEILHTILPTKIAGKFSRIPRQFFTEKVLERGEAIELIASRLFASSRPVLSFLTIL